MISIGFRCWDDRFSFVVLKGTQSASAVVASEQRKVPANAPLGEALVWMREEVREICSTHTPTRAYLKVTEPGSQTKDLKRARFEGVLLEAAQSRSIECATRIKVQLKKDLKFAGSSADVIDETFSNEFAGLAKAHFAEAAVAALAALPK